VEGVDFAIYENDGIVFVVSKRGDATIEKRGHNYRYSPVTGDPLDLIPVMQRLAETGNVHEEGFINDQDWFLETCANDRPDAVRRVFVAATSGVSNRANVIVNLEEGFYSGSSFFDSITRLHSTHGSIGHEQSNGFVMTTSAELPLYLRARDLWASIGSPRLRRAATKTSRC
jgi:hypothetical protein